MEDAAANQRAIIWFMWKEGEKTSNILRRLQEVFGDLALSKAQVYEWVSHFKDGGETLKDDPRTGQPTSAITSDMIRLVENCVLEDR